MSLGDQWMSCRQTSSRSSRPISLLPEFNVPPGVTDFALESRPPHLPRNSASRILGSACTSGACVIGMLCLLSITAGPVVHQGARILSGVRNAVGSALAHANDMEQQRVQYHYNARSEYMRRRGLSTRPEPEDIPQPPEPAASRPRAGKSSLLLRMAALRKVESAVSGIDDNAIEQYFPDWIVRRRDGAWNEDAVLRDLVSAVSQLAHKASVDQGENT